jgi:hypothetical protein
MPYYRLYLLNTDGRILHASEAEVENDAAGIMRARSIGHPDKVEIWQEKRKVGIVDPPR